MPGVSSALDYSLRFLIYTAPPVFSAASAQDILAPPRDLTICLKLRLERSAISNASELNKLRDQLLGKNPISHVTEE